MPTRPGEAGPCDRASRPRPSSAGCSMARWSAASRSRYRSPCRASRTAREPRACRCRQLAEQGSHRLGVRVVLRGEGLLEPHRSGRRRRGPRPAGRRTTSARPRCPRSSGRSTMSWKARSSLRSRRVEVRRRWMPSRRPAGPPPRSPGFASRAASRDAEQGVPRRLARLDPRERQGLERGADRHSSSAAVPASDLGTARLVLGVS